MTRKTRLQKIIDKLKTTTSTDYLVVYHQDDKYWMISDTTSDYAYITDEEFFALQKQYAGTIILVEYVKQWREASLTQSVI